MVDDPRRSFQARLDAKAAVWKKQRVLQQESLKQQGSGVSNLTSVWQQKAEKHQIHQEHNPFSGEWKATNYVQPHKEDATYGRPPEGSKTEFRGKQADVHISNEIVELCHIIQELGHPQSDGAIGITFGLLFETYTRISNKLVGMLMRARKQGLVKFEGEMLFQRRDDDTIIWLVQTPEALEADITRRKQDLQNHPVQHK